MGSDFWISYTDIMTGLLFIFIITIVVFLFRFNYVNKMLIMSEQDSVDIIALQEELNKLKESVKNINSIRIELIKENQNLKNQYQEIYSKYISLLVENSQLNRYKENLETYKEDWYKGFEADAKIIELLRQITRELNRKNIKVRLDETNKTLNIYSSVVGFESGKHNIKEKYKDVVSEIAHLLKRKIDQNEVRGNIDAIFIEGYTDDKPLDSEVFGNWGLSARRAISFWFSLNDALKDQESDLKNIKNANEQKLLFSVSGYANIRPIDCKDFANDSSLFGASNYSNNYKENKCKEYQECLMTKNPDSCKWELGGILNDEYDTMNRRIGIRFIPYHKK